MLARPQQTTHQTREGREQGRKGSLLWPSAHGIPGGVALPMSGVDAPTSRCRETAAPAKLHGITRLRVGAATAAPGLVTIRTWGQRGVGHNLQVTRYLRALPEGARHHAAATGWRGYYAPPASRRVAIIDTELRS